MKLKTNIIKMVSKIISNLSRQIFVQTLYNLIIFMAFKGNGEEDENTERKHRRIT